MFYLYFNQIQANLMGFLRLNQNLGNYFASIRSKKCIYFYKYYSYVLKMWQMKFIWIKISVTQLWL